MIFDRAQVVTEARSWLRTPYHKGAMVKGAGVDCGTLLLAVFIAAGFISAADAETIKKLIPVGADWFQHSDEEKYLKLVIRYARLMLTKISYASLEAKPGNIVVTHHFPKIQKWNHGGIVTKWPRVVHAIGPHVEEVDASCHALWSYRPVMVFDPWAKYWESYT